MIWTTRQRSERGALAAIEAGQGPLVVLLHGVGLRAEAWAGQIEALAANHRVLALDLPGHGASGMGADMGLWDYTDMLVATLDEPALVVGHSMGAMIALDMATRHPDRIRGVAALNAIFERSPAAAQAVQARADSLDGATMADPTTALQRWFGAHVSAQRDACERWLRSVDPGAYKMAYTAFAKGNGPSRAALDALSCPALFMTGADEPNSTPQMSQTMAALSRNGRALVLANAAHMMPMTHPEAVNRALLSFAQKVWT